MAKRENQGRWAGAGQPRLNFGVFHGHARATCALPPPEAQLLFLGLRSERTTTGCRPTEHPPGPIPLEKKKTPSALDPHQVTCFLFAWPISCPLLFDWSIALCSQVGLR